MLAAALCTPRPSFEWYGRDRLLSPYGLLLCHSSASQIMRRRFGAGRGRGAGRWSRRSQLKNVRNINGGNLGLLQRLLRSVGSRTQVLLWMIGHSFLPFLLGKIMEF